MSGYNSRGGGLPPVPPPPALAGHHPRSSRQSGRSRSRSRSRSPHARRTGGGSSYSKDWDQERRGHQSRSRRSPSPYHSKKSKSDEMRPVQESGPSSSGGATYKFQEPTPKKSRATPPDPVPAPVAPTVNRLPPADKANVIRQIVNPDTVRIPRRENEGLRPIFDRDELREAILRRMKSGDNEENPAPVEQRVVAIIREPVMQNMPTHFPLQHQEVIPILPMQMPLQMQAMQLQNAQQLQVMEERYAAAAASASGVTTSGVPFSMKQVPGGRRRGSGSRSPSNSRSRPRGRPERGRDDGSSERPRARVAPLESRRSRSRSQGRVQRVRTMRGRSGSRSVTPPQIPTEHRHFSSKHRERGNEDLRESLNRQQSAKAEIAPELAPDQPPACWHCGTIEVGHKYYLCGQRKREEYLNRKYGNTNTNRSSASPSDDHLQHQLQVKCKACNKFGHHTKQCFSLQDDFKNFGVVRYREDSRGGFQRGARRGVYRGGAGGRVVREYHRSSNSHATRGPWKHDMYDREDGMESS